MVTVWVSNERCEEWPDDDPRVLAYQALYRVSEQMGKQLYESGLYRPPWPGCGYTLTAEHIEVTKAMPAVLDGRITPEAAMALCLSYGVFEQRFGKRDKRGNLRKRWDHG